MSPAQNWYKGFLDKGYLVPFGRKGTYFGEYRTEKINNIGDKKIPQKERISGIQKRPKESHVKGSKMVKIVIIG